MLRHLRPCPTAPVVSAWSAAAIVLLSVIGCDNPDSATPAESRIEWLTAQPIAGAQSLTEAVSVWTDPPGPPGTPPPPETTPVSIRGRIGIGEAPAFEPDRAAFLMSEIIDDPDAEDGHDASTCPFCKRKIDQAPKAYVVLVDEEGREVDQRADQLLSLNRDEIVQVRGEATFDKAMNTIRVRAEAIHKEL